MSIRPISDELQKKAIEELNEVPSRIKEDIKQIREWLAQEAHLAHIKIEDQKILSFLRGCKFSLQKTKQKLDMFYTMKSLLPEFYSNRDPLRSELQETLSLGVCLPLLKTANNGLTIILARCQPPEPKPELFLNVFKIFLMMFEILIEEDDNFIITGQHGFVDLKEITLKHLLYLDINIFKKGAICLERAYPIRPKGIHYLRTPDFIEKFLNVVRALLSAKLRSRMKVHNAKEVDEVYKTIPNSILPKDYGGDGESIEELTAYWKKKVEDYREWFLEDEKNRSDESKRVGIPKTSADLFGMEGSFRKLEVD